MERTATSWSSRAANAALAAAFVIFLALPVLDSVLRFTPRGGNTEQRRLAEFPELRPDKSIKEYPKLFEAWFNDHFGMRDFLIAWNNRIHMDVFRVSTSPMMIIGKEGWLYYTGEDEIKDHRGATPFSGAELLRILENLEERRVWLESRGISYALVIAPNKESVYPEYLPETVRRVRDGTRLDQVLAYVRQRSPVDIMDLRPALIEAKKTRRVYESTGTHWNNEGAFTGYAAILRKLAEDFPSLAPKGRDAFRVAQTTVEKPSLVKTFMPMLRSPGTEDVAGFEPLEPRRAEETDYSYEAPVRGADPGNPRKLIHLTIPGSGQPSVVWFRDSFMDSLDQFVREHFRESLYVASREFDAGVVSRANPDIVLNQMAERFIAHALVAPRNEDAVRDFYRKNARGVPAGWWWLREKSVDTSVVLHTWRNSLERPDEPARLLLGDLDGDGRCDAAIHDRGTGDWYAALATSGGEFYIKEKWLSGFGGDAGNETGMLGDADGDHKADAVLFDRHAGSWLFAKSDGKAFTELSHWTEKLEPSSAMMEGMLGDADGDGRMDAVVHARDSGDWFVAVSGGGKPAAFVKWLSGFGNRPDAERCFLADIDGDRRADAVVFDRQTGQWWVAKSTRTAFVLEGIFLGSFGTQPEREVRFCLDADLDGKSDAVISDTVSGEWHWAKSTGSAFTPCGMLDGQAQADAVMKSFAGR